MWESVAFVIAVAAPWIGVAAAVLPVADGSAARHAAWATATGAVAAVSGGAMAAAGERPPGGEMWAGDAVTVLMLILVSGLSAVIQLFALRYLRGDARQRWFAIWANALTGSTAVMVSAGTVVSFAVGWIAAGVSLVCLLNTYGSLPQARQGVRRTALSLLVADAPLVVAVLVLAVSAGGDVRLDRVGDVLSAEVALPVALLLVISALGRSAQIPFHRWLPATLSAPTPVSALLHAGVVNAGAILLIRFAPLIAPLSVAMLVVFVAGSATLVYATAVRLVKPDVKGRLVFSTAGQMGFMMMAIGLGAFAGAVFHLIAHALYKSGLFLSAGSGVAAHTDRRAWPAPQPVRRTTTVIAILIAVALTIGVLSVGKAVLSLQVTPAGLALLGFVACTGIVGITAGLRRALSPGTVIGAIVVVAGGGLVYLAFLGVFESLIAPRVTAQPVSPWLLLVPGALLLAIELLSRSRRGTAPLRDALYARTLAASAVRPAHGIRTVPSRQTGVVK